MKKQKSLTIFKWMSVLILASSAIFFFLPYKDETSAFELIRLVYSLGEFSKVLKYIIFSIFIPIILPVIFTLLSAILLMLKPSIPKSVFATVFCVLATIIYQGFNQNADGIGLTCNKIVAASGIILPIVYIVLIKRLNNKNAQPIQ